MTSLSVAKLVISRIRRESRFVFPTLSRSKLNLDLGGADCAFCALGDCGVSGGVLLGSAVAALEREEREEEFCFQMVDLGGEYCPFSFRDENVDGSCAGCGLG